MKGGLCPKLQDLNGVHKIVHFVMYGYDLLYSGKFGKVSEI